MDITAFLRIVAVLIGAALIFRFGIPLAARLIDTLRKKHGQGNSPDPDIDLHEHLRFQSPEAVKKMEEKQVPAPLPGRSRILEFKPEHDWRKDRH